MNVKGLFKDIRAFAFDVDGVLAASQVIMMNDVEPVRIMASRDAIALQMAIKEGYEIHIITGGSSLGTKARFEKLGVTTINTGVKDKAEAFSELLRERNLQPSHTLYMGDDLPDYYAMKKAGVAVCPSNAATEIKSIAAYITGAKGGDGAVREIIEQVLRVQDRWFKP